MVEPGFTVAMRLSHGVNGEDDDLALSVEWRDAEGCLWAADFMESALALAELQDGTVSLRDVDGATMVFQLYQSTKQIVLSSDREK